MAPLAFAALMVLGVFAGIAIAPPAQAATAPGCTVAGSVVTCSTAGSFTYTPSAGVCSVQVEAWGGGGGGGNAYWGEREGGGGGGAGGSFARSTRTVTSTGYAVQVGAGGNGGPAAGSKIDGSPGGDSWFESTATVMAKGGGGGFAAESNDGSGGAFGGSPGAGSVGTETRLGGTGGRGADAFVTYFTGGGGGAGGPGANGQSAANQNGGSGTAPGGDGADGLTGAGNGPAGAAPGGGGAGAGAVTASGSTNFAGGNGGTGRVVITETPFSCAPCSTGPPSASASTVAPATRTVAVAAWATITVTLIDGTGNCVSGAAVTLSSSRGAPPDTINTNPTSTDAAGQAVFQVTSSSAGTSTYTVTDVTHGVTLATTVDVTYVQQAQVTGGCTVSGSVITCTGTGTYQPASGVTCVKGEAWGGGGGGGGKNGNGYAGGGGAGGAYAQRLIPVTGTVYPVTVGAGGAGGAAGNNPGVPGGDSSFTGASGSQVLAKGGARGLGDSTGTAGTGGAGTTAGSVGTILFAGGNGVTGSTTRSGGAGGGAGSAANGGNGANTVGGAGGATGGGAGGDGRANTGAGFAGTAAGGGGGGGFDTGTSNQAGGAGARGQVILTEYGLSGAGFAASPAGVPADGSTSSTVTVTLSTPCGGLPGKTVRLTSDRGATDTITPVSAAPLGADTATTDASGQARFTIVSATCGVSTLTAVDTTDGYTLPTNPTVSFAATSGASASSAFTASPATQLANGVATSTLTATLRTPGGCPVSGQTVTVASSRGALDAISPASVTTGNTGIASFAVTSTDWTTNGGFSTYTASNGGSPLTQTANVQWTVPISGLAFVDQPQNTGRGLPFVPVVRVMVLDSAGNPWSGAPMEVTLSVAGSPAGVRLVNGPGQDTGAAAPKATTNAQGIASFPGMAVVVDSLAFTGAKYQLRAATSAITQDSFPFYVGKTSPPWQQQGFSPQRTTWSPNIADFRDPAQRSVMGRLTAGAPGSVSNSIGDIATTPVLADLLGNDGILDIVLANSVPMGKNGPTGVVQARAYNGATLASPWGATQVTYTIESQQAAGPQLAAVYPAGSTTPYIVLANVQYGNPANPYDAGVNVYNSAGTLLQSWAPPGGVAPTLASLLMDVPILVAPTAAGGESMVVLLGTADFASTTVEGLSMAPSGAMASAWTGTFGTGSPWGGALASAEMRSANGLTPEVVATVPYEVYLGGGPTAGWNSGLLNVCAPSGAAGNCAESFAFTNMAPTGVALGHLDDDGRVDVVVDGLRSTAAATALGGGQPQLAVVRGTSNPVASPLVRTGEGDQYTWPSLGVLGDADNVGRMDIVNTNYGAPPRADPSGGDTYGDAGSVQRRGLDAASTAIQAEGTWARAGTSTASKESFGGGILLDTTADGHPEYLFGSRDGSVYATDLTGGPTQLWSMGALGSLTAADPSQGIPMAPLAAGDITGDCHAEVFVGLSGGQSGQGELAILRGKSAVAPGAPSFASPTNYGQTPAIAAWAAVGAGTSPGDDQTLPAYAPYGYVYATPASYQAHLAWNGPATDGGLPIVAYYVYRTTGPSGGPAPAFSAAWTRVGVWPSGIPPTLSNPFLDTTLPFNVDADYYYEVAPVTCFTLANPGTATSGNAKADGAGPVTGSPFYAEVKRPKGPTALSGVPAGSGIQLTWTAPALAPGAVDKPHGCGLTAGFTYNVYRRNPSTGAANIPGPPGTPGNRVAAGVSGTTWADSAVTGGQAYDYEVAAVNCVGESVRSNLVRVTAGTPPATPANVRLQPYGTPAYGPSDPGAGLKSVRVDWDAVATPSGDCPSLNGYDVYRSPASLGTWTYLGGVSVGLTTYTDLGAPLGADYDYAVTAFCGTSPNLFESAKQSPPPTTQVRLPTSVAAPTVAQAGNAIQVAWADAGAVVADCGSPTLEEEGYVLSRGASTGGPYAWTTYQTVKSGSVVAGAAPNGWKPVPGAAGVSTPSPVPAVAFTDSGLAAGTSYKYRVEAVNCVGKGAAAADSVALPALPAGVTAKPHGFPAYDAADPGAGLKRVLVAWSPVTVTGDCAGITAYNVYRSPTGAGTWSAVGSGAASPYTDATAAEGATYDYAVSASCPGLEGPMSALATAALTLPTTPAAAPTATPAAGPSVHVAWVDPGANNANCNWEEGYRVYRSDNGGAFNPVGLVTGTPSWTVGTPRAVAGWAAPSPAPLLYYDDTSIAAGNTYQYKFAAVNCVGESALSPPADVSTGNSPPEFQDLGPQTTGQVGSNTPVSVPAWAFAITPGAGASEAGQKLRFTTTFDSGDATLLTGVTVAPTGAYAAAPWSGDLAYTVVANKCGQATYKVKATDDGVMAPPPNDAPADSLEHALVIDVTCLNTPPTFTDLGSPAPIAISATANPVSATGWASSISQGTGAAEGSQQLRFNVAQSGGSATLLSVPPAVAQSAFSPGAFNVAPWGDLTYEVAANECGTAAFDIALEDDGAMTIGPDPVAHATSAVHTLTIAVTCPANSPPTFNDAGSPGIVAMPAADTPVTLAGWASSISPGANPEESAQQLRFAVTQTSGPAGLFAAAPSMAPTSFAPGPWAGDLTYTLKANTCGKATFDVTAEDDGVMTVGPTPLGQQTSVAHSVTIEVNCRNTAPSFTNAPDPAVVDPAPSADVPMSTAAWASAVSVGAGAGEAAQRLAFTVTRTSGTLVLADEPTVSPTEMAGGPWSGDLAYTLKAGACGRATYKVVLSDDGVMVPPPDDTPMSSTEHALTIQVRCPNTVPTFNDQGAPAAVAQVAVDTTMPTVTGWASAILPGANAEESVQRLKFTVAFASGNPSLLTATPTVFNSAALAAGPFTVAPWGDLSYRVKAGQCGQATYRVTLSDDGAMSPPPNAAPLTSVDHFLTLSVTCLNSAPSFTVTTPSLSILEDNPLGSGGPVTVNGFAGSITAGSAAWETAQKLSFAVTVVTNPQVFASTPTVSMETPTGGPFTAAAGWGKLTYQLAPDKCGIATFRVTLTDDGSGTAPQANSVTLPPANQPAFSLNVQCVNDPPAFTPQDVTVFVSAGPQTLDGWTSPAPARPSAVDEQWGGANQQRLSFATTLVSATNGLTFSAPPLVTPTAGACPPTGFCAGPFTATTGWGRLTFAATDGLIGVATLRTCLKDSGGLAPSPYAVNEACATWHVNVASRANHEVWGDMQPRDHDADGIETGADNCAGSSNPDQDDSAGAGQGDACNPNAPVDDPPVTPEDPPASPAGAPEPDFDRDGIADSADNCRFVANHDQGDLDRDALGDACDADMDGDGVANEALDGDAYVDGCPTVPDRACDEPAPADGVEPEAPRSVPASWLTPAPSQQGANLAGLAIAALGALVVSGLVALWVLRRRRQE